MGIVLAPRGGSGPSIRVVLGARSVAAAICPEIEQTGQRNVKSDAPRNKSLKLERRKGRPSACAAWGHRRRRSPAECLGPVEAGQGTDVESLEQEDGPYLMIREEGQIACRASSERRPGG
jgi:hypothetical protein